MEIQQRQKATPAMILKTVGLSLSMALGFGAAFYAGYNRMPYILPACVFLEMSCFTSLILLNRYLKGTLLREPNANSMTGSFWLGCVMLFFSIAGCFFYAISVLVKIKGIYFKEYELYAALVPCVVSVFWSSVLIYDAGYYKRMWQREAGYATARAQIGMMYHPGHF